MSETLTITHLLQNCRELSAFCTQNGWVINESIYYEILERRPDSLLIYVTFLESIMEGAGWLPVRSESLLWPFAIEIECAWGDYRRGTGLIYRNAGKALSFKARMISRRCFFRAEVCGCSMYCLIISNGAQPQFPPE